MNTLIRFNVFIYLLFLSHACIDLERETKKEPLRGDQAPFSLTRDPQQYLTLQQFSECQPMLTHLREQRLARLDESLASQRYYLERRLNSGSSDDGREMSPTAEEAQADASNEAGGSPQEVSETNTQVAGVDEPDMVKTDGNYIYTVAQGQVHITKSWPANELSSVATIAVDGIARDLLLTADKKLLITYNPYYSLTSLPPNGNREPIYGDYDWQQLVVKLVDVNDPTAPQEIKQWRFQGYYLSTRRIDQKIYLVQNQYQHDQLKGTIPWIDIWQDGGQISLDEFDRRAALAHQKNQAILSQAGLAELLDLDQSTDDLVFREDTNCQNVYAPGTLEFFGYTKVTAIDLANQSLNQNVVMVPSNQIYASKENLYVSLSSAWFWSDSQDWQRRTFLHRFAITGDSPLSYSGSGQVNGYLNNQFSMDEHEGILRLALTQDVPFENSNPEDDLWWGARDTINRVVTMQLTDGKLQQIGQSEALARGERIYSARFNGNKGFMVTFRQVDPLYTFDLSDPTQPRMIGELKIPGFSSYIHLIDDNHLLAVGQAGTEDGRIEGLKISIFDVSDFASPIEAHQFRIEADGWSWSEAAYDHHAFSYFASRKLLAIPVGGYRRSVSRTSDRYFSELQVFEIDPTSGITPRGGINMRDVADTEADSWYDWWSGAQVRRSVFADDFIYAISGAGIKAVHNSDLSTTIGAVRFPAGQ